MSEELEQIAHSIAEVFNDSKERGVMIVPTGNPVIITVYYKTSENSYVTSGFLVHEFNEWVFKKEM